MNGVSSTGFTRRSQQQQARKDMPGRASGALAGHRQRAATRLCQRYRCAAYAASAVVVVQLLAACTFFLALESDQEGRGRRDEMVWSADRELGRPGVGVGGGEVRELNPKLSGVHDAVLQHQQQKGKETFEKFGRVPPDVLPRQQVTANNVLPLGIFKEVMEQYKDSPIRLHGNKDAVVVAAAKGDSDRFPLDRRRKKLGKQLPALSAREDANSNQPINSALANSNGNKRVPAVAGDAMELPGYRLRKANLTMVGGNGTGVAGLEYSAKCRIDGKDATSALSRATSARCKQELADVVCEMQWGSLYPPNMTRVCPLAGKPDNPIEDEAKFKIVEGRPVRIVFMLVVHGRALRQVRRLIRLLFHTDHYFYIHVDLRSNYLHRELTELAKGFANIKLTPWRLASIWGGASLLQVYLRGMDDLLAMEDWQWDFFINLSESDMPIRNNDYLVSFLSRYRKFNFLKAHGNDEESKTDKKNKSKKGKKGFIKKQGLDKVFYECDARMWRLGDRKLPTGITLDGGSDWITINRQFAEFVTLSQSELLAGLKQMYKYTLLPAESFFHTLLENSELCKTLVDNNLRVTNWKRKLGCQCQYKHIVDWCGCSPNDFKPEDMYKTKPNRPAFFARKFEPVINQAVINQLDHGLYGSYPVGTPGSRSYWQSLHHHLDSGDEAPKDLPLTVYQSFVRLMAAHINMVSQEQPYDNHCAYNIKSNPREVTMFFQNDAFRGLVVTVEGETSAGNTDFLEVWMSLASDYRIINYVGPSTRLQKFQVSTQYDPKERVLRNFAGILGPQDSPVVFIKWKPGEPMPVTISWIDPTNHVAASFDTTVDRDKEETHHSPPFRHPLRPGRWAVKLLHQWTVVAEVDFLVVPQALAGGRPLASTTQAGVLNAGVANNSYVDKDFSSMRALFQLADSGPLVREADRRAQLVGGPLQDWVDEVVGQHWSVMGFCVAPASRKSKTTDCRQFKPCYDQTWSTLSPDPKSDLGFIKSDGRIR